MGILIITLVGCKLGNGCAGFLDFRLLPGIGSVSIHRWKSGKEST